MHFVTLIVRGGRDNLAGCELGCFLSCSCDLRKLMAAMHRSVIATCLVRCLFVIVSELTWTLVALPVAEWRKESGVDIILEALVG